MPRKQRNELTAGIVVVAAVILLLAVTLWIGAAGLFQRYHQRAVFYVHVEQESGLKVGSIVTMGGVEVGRIIDIELTPDEGRTYYIAGISRKDITIRADCTATELSGLLGSARLTVRPGSGDTTLADRDHPVHFQGGLAEGMQNFTRATESLANAAADVETITGALVAEADVDTPGSILANIKSASAKFDGIAGKAYEAADNLSQMLVSARAMIAKINSGEGTIGQLINDERLHIQLLDMADQLTAMLEEAQALLTRWREEGVIFKLN
ncbi:MAG: MlaD family protein [Planctomycetota bacterium]|jgi:phospholipid/cholesterol/gamma-HCH transport system substrate-binding protein